MTLLLEGSVGLSGRNYPIDVAIIQRLLTDYFTQTIPVKGRCSRVIKPAIMIDGECDQALIDRIKAVQTQLLGMKKADGRIDPGGRTLSAIETQTRPISDVKARLFGPAPRPRGVVAEGRPPALPQVIYQAKGAGAHRHQGRGSAGFFSFLQHDPDIENVDKQSSLWHSVRH